MPIRTRYHCLLFCWILLTGGCATLERAVQKPDLSFAGVEMQQASLSEATVGFKLDVTNPNRFAVPIQALHYDLALNGKPLFSGVAEKGTRLPAQGQSQLLVPVTFQYQALFDNLQQVFTQDSVEYRLKGSLDLGLVSVPYETSGRLPLPSMPQVALRAVKVQSIGLGGVDFAVSLAVDNPNPFPIDVQGLSYRLNLAESSVIQGVSDKAIAVAANGKDTVDLSFKLGLTELGRAAMALRSSSSLPVSFDGELGLKGNQSLPLHWSGDVPIAR